MQALTVKYTFPDKTINIIFKFLDERHFLKNSHITYSYRNLYRQFIIMLMITNIFST